MSPSVSAVPASFQRFLLLGVSHRTAPLAVRERLTSGEASLAALGQELRTFEGLREHLLLHTCNRTELYACLDASADASALHALFARHLGLGDEELSQYGSTLDNEAAARHLFALTSGLDSQLVGETEILGQVKTAYTEADRAGTLGPVLHRLFQKSFQAAKWARTHTGIGKGQTSIGNVAVELAVRIYGDLRRCRVLLLGSGKVGRLALQALVRRGAKDVLLASRTRARAEALATEMACGSVLSMEEALGNLHRRDIVLTSTSATEPVLAAATVAQALRKRPGRPLFLIDLAVPRDIEPSAGEPENAFLYNLDDLAAIANENLREREGEIEAARATLHGRALRVWEDLTTGPRADTAVQQSDLRPNRA